MIEIIAGTLVLFSHGDGPYDWHMSCDRWLERRVEIAKDDHLDPYNKRFLIRYLRSKVEEDCPIPI